MRKGPEKDNVMHACVRKMERGRLKRESAALDFGWGINRKFIAFGVVVEIRTDAIVDNSGWFISRLCLRTYNREIVHSLALP